MNLENEILDAVRGSISESIQKVLVGYNSPLALVVGKCVTEHEPQIRAMINEALTTVIETSTFRVTIQEEFQRKVAKTLVSELESSVAKAAAAIKADPTLRARMILGLQQIIENG